MLGKENDIMYWLNKATYIYNNDRDLFYKAKEYANNSDKIDNSKKGIK